MKRARGTEAVVGEKGPKEVEWDTTVTRHAEIQYAGGFLLFEGDVPRSSMLQLVVRSNAHGEKVDEQIMNLLFEERVSSLDPIFGPMGLEAGRSIWAAADLSGREKTAILLAADVSVPELGLPFELHVAMGLRQVGMPVEHLRELLRHVALYAGYNITAMAFERLAAIAKELGFDPASRPETASSPQRVVYSEAVRSELQRLDPSLAADFEQQAGRAWNRPGLTMRERCLATLAVDVVGGTLGAPFEAHLDLATEAGLSDRALRSLIRILAEFSMPKAWQALSALDVRSSRLRQSRNTFDS